MNQQGFQNISSKNQFVKAEIKSSRQELIGTNANITTDNTRHETGFVSCRQETGPGGPSKGEKIQDRTKACDRPLGYQECPETHV